MSTPPWIEVLRSLRSAPLQTPSFWQLVGLAFAIQWVAFVPAWVRRTEAFFDLVGSITYVTIVVIAIWTAPSRDGRNLLLGAMVLIWSIRLGAFLFRRVRTEGGDRRFDPVRGSFWRFLAIWTLQGFWVAGSLAAALAAMTADVQRPLGAVAVAGILTWATGLAIEVAADTQKSRFRKDPTSQGRFIQTGLWAWSRHPNYFGDILVWIGIAVVAMPVLDGWRLLALASPLVVVLFLTRISGIPILERRANERWGGQPDYEAYKARTPVLIPRPPRDRRE